ncbi:hypothetical protein BKA61DRAFT_586992 [Leptodontidium sp. MPI-SDFR-AT-0119]|nr:hypothetical protein BKA61DRAFT_586992 [Leptodontidium sp. MPI-SDFR-AT-0119]
MFSDSTLPPEKRDSLLQLPPTPTAFDAHIPHVYPTERPFRPPDSYRQTPRNHAVATDQLHGLPSKCPPPWKPPKIWDYISITDTPKIVPGWLKEEQVEVMDAELRACEGVEMKKQFWALAALRDLLGRRRRRLLQGKSKRVHCTSKFRNLKSKI